MKLEIPVEDLKKNKLFLAVPMYGGQCSGMFTRSVADLTGLCVKYGIGLQLYFLFNESLITRARNYCVDEFIRSECTHLMFIDSDIGFKANDVVAMLGLSGTNDQYDVMCGPYPKKTISWEKIKQAVDKGVADEDPSTLENYVGDYVFNFKKTGSIPLNEPAEVLEGGTGFMLIKRKVFEEYDKHFPEQKYKPDHVRTKHFDGTREIMAYFDCIIDPESKRYLSEDYMFCYNVQRAGMKVWLCPWIQLQHVGSYVFGGSLGHLASIGASATADVKKLGSKK